MKQRAHRFGAARPRLGFASELNTGLPTNHDVARLRAAKISVAFQNALPDMGLILFVVFIVGGMSYLVR